MAQPCGAAAAPAPAPVAAAPAAGAITAEPANVQDAVTRMLAVAKYLRNADKASPAAYMMASGFRFGELRAKGANIDPALLAAPSGEVRQNLKKLATENKWPDVVEAAQDAAAGECGRAWLDVHRYIARACEKIGASHQGMKAAVVAGVRALLNDYPKLPEMTLMDDTPTANAETIRAFIEEVLNQGHFERMNDLVLENFIELDPLPGQQQGREGLKAVLVGFRTAFPDIRFAPDSATAALTAADRAAALHLGGEDKHLMWIGAR